MEGQLLINSSHKLKQWLRVWLKTTFNEILSPLSDAAALVQILPVFFVIYLVYLANGNKAMETEILNIWAAQQTLIAIIPAFVIVCMIRAAFLTTNKLSELGQWHDDTFVFNTPQQVFTLTVSSEDNNKTHFFKVKDVPIDSLVTVGFCIDRRDERVKAQITENGQPHIDWRGATSIIRSGFRLPNDRKLGLLTLADFEANPTTIRVYAYSWKVLPPLN